jgi:hypothetical protein
VGLNVIVGARLEDDPELLENLRADFAAVNEALREAGLPEHHEPESADWTPVDYDMIGYSGLHYLRRIAAHLDNGGPLPPPGTEESVDGDSVLERYYDRAWGGSTVRGFLRATFARNKSGRFDHLMLHSDAEGFYIPIRFDEVLVSEEVVGGMIGSSQGLYDELLEVARALGLPTDLDPDSDELLEAARSQGEGEGWKAYGIESLTCLQLLGAARASVKHDAAIVFA